MYDDGYCPKTTHSCITISNYGEIPLDKICCPNPCFDDGNSYGDRLTFYKGKCYKQVKLGEQCIWDDQCTYYGWSGAICKQGIVNK